MTSCAGPGTDQSLGTRRPSGWTGQVDGTSQSVGPDTVQEGDDWDAKSGKEDRMSLVPVLASQLKPESASETESLEVRLGNATPDPDS